MHVPRPFSPAPALLDTAVSSWTSFLLARAPIKVSISDRDMLRRKHFIEIITRERTWCTTQSEAYIVEIILSRHSRYHLSIQKAMTGRTSTKQCISRFHILDSFLH